MTLRELAEAAAALALTHGDDVEVRVRVEVGGQWFATGTESIEVRGGGQGPEAALTALPAIPLGRVIQ